MSLLLNFVFVKKITKVICNCNIVNYNYKSARRKNFSKISYLFFCVILFFFCGAKIQNFGKILYHFCTILVQPKIMVRKYLKKFWVFIYPYFIGSSLIMNESNWQTGIWQCNIRLVNFDSVKNKWKAWKRRILFIIIKNNHKFRRFNQQSIVHSPLILMVVFIP